MSSSTIVYLGGMLVMFAGQRLAAGHDGISWTLTLIAVGSLAAALLWRMRGAKKADDAGLRLGHRLALMLMFVGCGSLVLYAGSTETVARGLGLDEDSERRWTGVWSALWPILWLLGTLPLVILDHAMWRSPIMIQARRVRTALQNGVLAALGVALAFPINYLGTRHNERWDLAYFKTSEVGTATQAIVASLEAPITVRIFLPPSSELAEELRGYFGQLEGPKLGVEILDQAAEPKLARKLKVKENGVVAFTIGSVTIEDEEPEDKKAPDAKEDPEDKPKVLTETLKIGKNMDAAKVKLKKLDEEVQQILLKMSSGDRSAYITEGHGELGWRGERPLDRKLSGFKKFLSNQMSFDVQPLPSTELAEAVPDDADVVLILGPEQPFLQAEVDALKRYLDEGGSVLIALEPKEGRQDAEVVPADDPLDEFVAHLGLRLGAGVLVSDQKLVPLFRNKRDRLNVTTASFSVHESTTVLSRASQLGAYVLTPSGGFLEEVEGAGRVTVTIRSREGTWADLNGNLELDEGEGETKDVRTIAAVSSGGEGESSWRALVVGDATAFSDLGLGVSRGNVQFAYDGVNWLIGAEALSGTVESEEDVKIEHTKEDDTIWFYGTVMFVPMLVLGGGAFWLRRRRRRSGR